MDAHFLNNVVICNALWESWRRKQESPGLILARHFVVLLKQVTKVSELLVSPSFGLLLTVRAALLLPCFLFLSFFF